MKAVRLLSGYRGRPHGDIDALIAAILAIQDYALANADKLLELGVNPMMIRPAGRGIVAAAVLIRLLKEEHHD